MGRITGIGKNTLRAILVEASWKLITKDQVMREKYERIKIRSGGKRAIVAIARTLLLRMRRMLLDGQAYALPLRSLDKVERNRFGAWRSISVCAHLVRNHVGKFVSPD